MVKRSPKTTEAKVTGDMDGLQENQQSGGEKGMSLAGRFFVETIPAVLAVGGMLGLIFGGCCSNVSFGRVLRVPRVQRTDMGTGLCAGSNRQR